MQKSEFEKQIQQKMDELKIPPSEAVWQSIEASISENKRRKRVWIFFVFLICLLGGGYFLWNSNGNLTMNRPGKTMINYKLKDTNNNDNNEKKILKESIVEKEIPVKANARENSVKNISSTKQNKQIVSQSIIINNNHKKRIMQIHYKQISATNSIQHSKNNITLDSKIYEDYSVADSIVNKNFLLNHTQNFKHENEIISTPKNKIIGSQINEINTKDKSDSLLKQIIIDSINNHEQAKIEKNVAHNKNRVIKNAATRTAWKWGLTFSAGVSDISKSFLGSDFLGSGSAEKSLFAEANSYNSIPQSGTDTLKKPYLIKPSLALNVGLLTTKKITKSSSVTLGINYKLLSTTNKVGKKSVNQRYYQVENPVNLYKNYYHFVEVPVSYSLHFGKPKMPLALNAGISISQLVATNALQFNNTSGIYYYDNSLFKKTQLGFSTGIYFSNKNNTVFIGPHIYYGITKIADEGLYKYAHFTYLGIASKILFKK